MRDFKNLRLVKTGMKVCRVLVSFTRLSPWWLRHRATRAFGMAQTASLEGGTPPCKAHVGMISLELRDPEVFVSCDQVLQSRLPALQASVAARTDGIRAESCAHLAELRSRWMCSILVLQLTWTAVRKASGRPAASSVL